MALVKFALSTQESFKSVSGCDKKTPWLLGLNLKAFMIYESKMCFEADNSILLTQ